MLTSSDRPEDVQRALSLGVTSYLTKSVSCENVLALLPRLLGGDSDEKQVSI